MNTLLKQLLLAAALGLTCVGTVFGEPAKPASDKTASDKTAPAKPAPVLSVFVMPAGVREGRDPFYPESTRPYEGTAPAAVAVDPAEATVLKVPGYSFSNGKRMVIINNHTFGIGEDGDVMTTSGRVHIRCLDIRNDSTTVEVNGRRRELKIGTK